jgi:hypothetical protein
MPTTLNNMNLQVPNPGETNYPTSVSNSLTNIDNHDHTSGKGLQIPTGGIADSAVTAAKLASDAVTTAKILNANVTKAKLASVGQQKSTTRGSAFSTVSATLVDVTSLSISITTTGRPVIIGLTRDGSGSGGGFYVEAVTPTAAATIAILRDSTEVYKDFISFSQNYSGVASGTAQFSAPLSLISIDAPAAGTYTYKVQVALNNGSFLSVAANVNIFAYEL